MIDQSKHGSVLSSKDRRHCVAYLMATQAQATKAELADIFHVSEKTIRNDMDLIRLERARDIKQEDIGLVVADIVMTLERQVHDLEKSKAQCKVGTAAYLSHCKAIHEIRLSSVKALQDLGFYPKNLGNLTVDKYEYSSIVVRDDSKPERPMEYVPTIDAEFEPVEDLKQLPAPEHDSPASVPVAAAQETAA